MNLLYILSQQSYTSKNGQRRWTLQDPQLLLFLRIAKELIERTDWGISVMYGRPIESVVTSLIDSDRVTWIDQELMIDTLLQKYDFDASTYAQILLNKKFDVIINTNSEITRNLRALLSCIQYDAKLIQFVSSISVSFLDEEEQYEQRIDPIFRQIDGALSADLTTFLCPSLHDSFLESAWLLVGKTQMAPIQSKTSVWNIGFSREELRSLKRKRKTQKPIILFPHQFDKANSTKWREFVVAIEKLSKTNASFQVVVTNPTHSVSWNWLEDTIPHLKVLKEGPLSREEYIKLLWESSIIVNLLTLDRYGGFENVEGIFCKCFPVMPRIHEYARRAPNDYPGIIRMVTSEEIKDALYYLLTNYEWLEEKYMQELIDINVETSCGEINISDAIDDIETLVNN
jgi:hypothetical protein